MANFSFIPQINTLRRANARDIARIAVRAGEVDFQGVTAQSRSISLT